jgi:hypothetical protein
LAVQGKKLAASLLAVVMFSAVLLATYALHARYLPVDVVFYSALLDVFIAVAVSLIPLLVLAVFRSLEGFEKALLIVIWLLGGYAFAISVPTVIDRSLSFYLLEKLDQRGGGIRLDAMNDVLEHEFMQEYRVLDARLTEQLQSGTITIQDGCIQLTPKGRRIAGWSRTFRTEFLPRQRRILDSYSSELTTPLARSPDTVSYRCP